jgi:hypothetical protein
MDFRAQRTEHTAAVPLDGGFAVGVVLRGGTGDGQEFAIDALDRRATHTDAVLWNPEDGLVARRARIRGQCETGTPADAGDGAASDLSEATAVGSRVRTQDLSVSAGQPQDRSPRPRLGQRYQCAAESSMGDERRNVLTSRARLVAELGLVAGPAFSLVAAVVAAFCP